MKKILIYGDSNVWGDNFLTGKRIDDEYQWPNRLHLKDYKILQEGLPGRLAGNDESEKKFKNGKDTFLATFRTNAPVNNVIIMLGTNDLQMKYRKTKEQIIQDILWYYEVILEEFQDEDNKKKYFVENKMPEILLILPPNFDYRKNAKMIFDEKSEQIRKEVIKYLKENHEGFHILELQNMPLFEDGIHLNYEGHDILAHKVKEVIEHE